MQAGFFFQSSLDAVISAVTCAAALAALAPTLTPLREGLKVLYQVVSGFQSLPKDVHACLQRGKPVIVASQLLNSMMDVPVPTRAEVADCADAVRQSADALMLSAETAMGEHPIKCVQVLRGVRLLLSVLQPRQLIGGAGS